MTSSGKVLRSYVEIRELSRNISNDNECNRGLLGKNIVVGVID